MSSYCCLIGVDRFSTVTAPITAITARVPRRWLVDGPKEERAARRPPRTARFRPSLRPRRPVALTHGVTGRQPVPPHEGGYLQQHEAGPPPGPASSLPVEREQISRRAPPHGGPSCLPRSPPPHRGASRLHAKYRAGVAG